MSCIWNFNWYLVWNNGEWTNTSYDDNVYYIIPVWYINNEWILQSYLSGIEDFMELEDMKAIHYRQLSNAAVKLTQTWTYPSQKKEKNNKNENVAKLVCYTFWHSIRKVTKCE